MKDDDLIPIEIDLIESDAMNSLRGKAFKLYLQIYVKSLECGCRFEYPYKEAIQHIDCSRPAFIKSIAELVKFGLLKKYETKNGHNNLYSLSEKWRVDKENTKTGFVYVIKAGDFCKIGVTTNIKRRGKQIQTSTPYDIKVLISQEVRGYLRLEKELHKKYKNKKVRGEWFTLENYEICEINEYLINDQEQLNSPIQ